MQNDSWTHLKERVIKPRTAFARVFYQFYTAASESESMIFIPLRVFLGCYLCVIFFRFTNSLGRYYFNYLATDVLLQGLQNGGNAVRKTILISILPELKLILLFFFRGEFVRGFPGGYSDSRDLS